MEQGCESSSPMSHNYEVEACGSGGTTGGSSNLGINLSRSSQHITQISHSVHNPNYTDYIWPNK